MAIRMCILLRAPSESIPVSTGWMALTNSEVYQSFHQHVLYIILPLHGLQGGSLRS